MEELIKTVTSNTLYLAIAIILGVMVVICVVKKMMKLLLLSAIVIAGYVGYLHYTGQKIPGTREETVKHLKDKLDKGRELMKDNMKSMDVK